MINPMNLALIGAGTIGRMHAANITFGVEGARLTDDLIQRRDAVGRLERQAGRIEDAR